MYTTLPVDELEAILSNERRNQQMAPLWWAVQSIQANIQVSPNTFFIRKKTVIDHGNHQIIFRLDDELIVKARYVGETEDHYVIVPMYQPELTDTDVILRALGFEKLGIELPAHDYLRIEMDPRGVVLNQANELNSDVAVTRDLTVDGATLHKYNIAKLQELREQGLTDTEALQYAAFQAYQLIKGVFQGDVGEVYKSMFESDYQGAENLRIDVDPQRQVDGATRTNTSSLSTVDLVEAIPAMLMIQVKDNTGTLIVADQDNLIFYRR